MKTIDHATFARLGYDGSNFHVHVAGQRGGWTVLVTCDNARRILAASHRQQPHIFRRLDRLARYMRAIGIVRFDVDALNYDPRGNTAARLPIDAGGRNPAAEKSGYATWLEAEVREAIDDASPTIPHDEAMRQIRIAIGLS